MKIPRSTAAARRLSAGSLIGPVRRPLLLSIFCCLLLAGCASMEHWCDNGLKVGPNYCPPDARWPSPRSTLTIEASRSRPLDDTCWWTVFGDPASTGS